MKIYNLEFFNKKNKSAVRDCWIKLSLFLFIFLSCTFCDLQNDEDLDNKRNFEVPSPPIVRGFNFGGGQYEDFVAAAKLGANVVRIPLKPGIYADRKKMEFWQAWPSFQDELVKQMKNAKIAGLNVVVDLHQFPFKGVKDQHEFWNRNDLETRFCQVWSDLAQCLQPYKDIIWGYDILNEPYDHTQFPNPPKEWRPLAEKIVESIRKIDQETWIIFEPGPGGLFMGFKDLVPFKDDRIIYSAHFYLPHAFTHQGVHNHENTEINIKYPIQIGNQFWNKEKLNEKLQYADEFQRKWNVPIYVGEFSVVRWAPKESAIQYLSDVIDLFENRGWSWSYHSFREWHGWSLEHDEEFWQQGMPEPKPAKHETERMKVIKKALSKNKK